MTSLAGQSVWVMAKGYAPDEGGMQTYARSVAEAYAQQGAKVTVITQTSIGPRKTRIAGIDIVDLGSDRSPLVLWKFCKALRQLERGAGRPDFLHATTWRTAVPPMLLGIPYAVTFHGREFMYPRGAGLAVMRRVARKAVRCIAVSHYSAQSLRTRLGRDAPSIAVAWNGTTADLPFAAANMGQNDPPIILSLCRLEPRKNIMAAVLAAARCRDDGIPFRYILCGRGPETGAIATAIERLDLTGHIEFEGFVDQARAEALYASADIFVHPQITVDDGRDFEGFGIAIADAMFCGQAVLVGRDGGTSELVTQGKTGMVVDGHDEDAVVEALQQLLTNTPLRQRIGREAASTAQTQFRWDRHVEIVMGRVPPD